jgi:hypothetical protein
MSQVRQLFWNLFAVWDKFGIAGQQSHCIPFKPLAWDMLKFYWLITKSLIHCRVANFGDFLPNFVIFRSLKVYYHEIVGQPRQLVVSFGLNNPLRISFTPEKSRVKKVVT